MSHQWNWGKKDVSTSSQFPVFLPNEPPILMSPHFRVEDSTGTSQIHPHYSHGSNSLPLWTTGDMLWHDSSANENKQRRFLGTAPWANSLPTLAPQAVRKWKVPQGYDAGNLEEKLQGVATSINLSRSSTSLSSPTIVAPIGWGHFPPAPCGRVNDGVTGQPVVSSHNTGLASLNDSDCLVKLREKHGDGDQQVAQLTENIVAQARRMLAFSMFSLQMAVKSGHIHVGVLHRPLSQNTLMLINQLLHSIQKSDQAASELHQLDEHPHSNAAIQAERRRLQQELDILKTEMDTLKHDINKDFPPAMRGVDVIGEGEKMKQRKWSPLVLRRAEKVHISVIDKSTDNGEMTDSDLGNGDTHRTSAICDDGLEDWKQGKLDWSPAYSVSGDFFIKFEANTVYQM